MFPSINYARVAVIVSCSFLLLILSLQALPSNASHGLVWVVYLTKWRSSEDSGWCLYSLAEGSMPLPKICRFRTWKVSSVTLATCLASAVEVYLVVTYDGKLFPEKIGFALCATERKER